GADPLADPLHGRIRLSRPLIRHLAHRQPHHFPAQRAWLHGVIVRLEKVRRDTFALWHFGTLAPWHLFSFLTVSRGAPIVLAGRRVSAVTQCATTTTCSGFRRTLARKKSAARTGSWRAGIIRTSRVKTARRRSSRRRVPTKFFAIQGGADRMTRS